MQAIAKASQWIGKTFAIWALLSAVLGFIFPEFFASFAKYIVPILGIIMFGMGTTLRTEDFVEIIKRPKLVLVGLLAQFTLMPLIAYVLTVVFKLDPMIAVGVILVGCCPGGTSSNVITFLAKGDVALSVSITSISTLLAPILTPILLKIFAGQLIEIELASMMISITKMVILPILLGLAFHKILGAKVQIANDILPMVSVLGIAIIIAAVIAVSRDTILTSGLLVFIVVALHNCIGYLLGYLLAKLSGFSEAQRRAIMVEVGMQNSGLGAALAATYFNPAASLPSAIFSVWHNFSGALVANFFVGKDKNQS
ncbi:MAG TPA: bile acid:sodium symporter family protein [Psychrobacter sp.]|uniref:Sodium Bile acid symporter family protein n=1 Tax=Psychrobacter pasteurii TaxID=1945520 RepID=A0A1R4EGI5_9GAMM|nr:bile acid:sodium symporter family protein [Psychrobacter pasteurii]SJM37596.1 Sodium Bile acid symporter family protein [Psychrobacter pasteurii]HAO59791.1 bile acid:sodium symporter family protein [Psychrobacter sp.]